MMKHLFRPIDSAILIYFRFFAGIFLAVELINSLGLGDLNEYLAPVHFSYLFSEWVWPWSVEAVVIIYVLTILAGFTFAVGFRQRVSAIVLFTGYTLLFLMEKSQYNNHLYLYCLLSFWIIWMPVVKNKKLSAPSWFYYLLIFHISVVYFYAGLAKLDSEWLSGDTIRVMLTAKYPAVYIYGGLAFDLLVVPLLLWKRTRVLAFISACVFHIINAFNFGLATFPWFSIMLTTLFFGTQWPRRFTWFDDFFPENDRLKTKMSWNHYLLVGGLGIYCFLHLVIPFRQHLYSGKASWTEDGHQFSWRMKLRSKTGRTFFYIKDKTSKKMRTIYPELYLTKRQLREMVGNPDSILQFAHFLRERNTGVEIYASSRVSLNGKPEAEMINVKVDLSLEERKLGSYSWVLPKEERPGFLRAFSHPNSGMGFLNFK
jgi:vitamin K-dependent gamma-carboxylase